jgi:hypothetical protein
MADWVTISSLATAGGTLVLAGATFASVRSANRAARVAEVSVLAGLRPLLMPSRLDDPTQKVAFMDEVFLRVDGGHGEARVTDEAVYLAISVRNAGTGAALLHGWRLLDGNAPENMRDEPPSPAEVTRLTRDIYVPATDIGFWQGTFRDPQSDGYRKARRAIEERTDLFVDVMYGDVEGGQRTVTRFAMRPVAEDGWLVSAGRVWNLDRADPR